MNNKIKITSLLAVVFIFSGTLYGAEQPRKKCKTVDIHGITYRLVEDQLVSDTPSTGDTGGLAIPMRHESAGSRWPEPEMVKRWNTLRRQGFPGGYRV